MLVLFLNLSNLRILILLYYSFTYNSTDWVLNFNVNFITDFFEKQVFLIVNNGIINLRILQ